VFDDTLVSELTTSDIFLSKAAAVHQLGVGIYAVCDERSLEWKTREHNDEIVNCSTLEMRIRRGRSELTIDISIKAFG
jgi:hypothetical protein